MLDDWTAEVVGRMHTSRITGQQLADECGYSAAYLSVVLHGKRGNEKTKARILDALTALEAKVKLSGCDPAGVTSE